MSTKTTRTSRLIAALLICAVGAGAVVGCSGEKAGSRDEETRRGEPAPDPDIRARQVADAWEGSEAAEQWRRGYHPMGEVVQTPEGGFRDEADERAFETGNFDLRGTFPASPHRDGRVRWKSSGSRTLPLMKAQEAYATLDRDSSPGRHLTVTGAELGEMTVITSRGAATVPAWHFALEGYDTPLKRAAIRPSKLPQPPVEPVRRVATDALAALGGLVEMAQDGRSVTVMATHGSCDDGPLVDVLETDRSVVLSASTVDADDGNCTGEMRGETVTVKLDRHLGDRMILDAYTGRPVPYSRWPEVSLSWS
ncbi:hypothetical protein [Streptomyces sp. NPDC018031]|uniref:hypothetical protein n=1 Tax=Streptomyces sp. NPDC018031 TaxID=3365033 RepID=UPI0037BBCACA